MKPSDDPRSPAWVERVPANLEGISIVRLIFIFRAPGCTYARSPSGGCSMCGFAAMTLPPSKISKEDLIAQFDSVFDRPDALSGISEVDLYNSGSFLADEEMSPEVRSHVFARLGGSSVTRVLIESRPEFILKGTLREASAHLSPGVLEVGIGLESATDDVRERLIRKGFDLPAFERAVAVLAAVRARLVANVLLKPLGLDEAAAIDVALKTGRYVFETAKRLGLPARVALQPVFVPPGTPIEKEFLAGRYKPPSLWSVIGVVKGLHPLGGGSVGMSEEGLGPKRSPAGCGLCDDSLRHALKEYNRTKSLGVFDSLNCSCRLAKPGIFVSV